MLRPEIFSQYQKTLMTNLQHRKDISELKSADQPLQTDTDQYEEVSRIITDHYQAVKSIPSKALFWARAAYAIVIVGIIIGEMRFDVAILVYSALIIVGYLAVIMGTIVETHTKEALDKRLIQQLNAVDSNVLLDFVINELEVSINDQTGRLERARALRTSPADAQSDNQLTKPSIGPAGSLSNKDFL